MLLSIGACHSTIHVSSIVGTTRMRRIGRRTANQRHDGVPVVLSCSVPGGWPDRSQQAIRQQLEERITQGKMGHLVLPRIVRDELAASAPSTNIPLRSSHVVQV